MEPVSLTKLFLRMPKANSRQPLLCSHSIPKPEGLKGLLWSANTTPIPYLETVPIHVARLSTRLLIRDVLVNLNHFRLLRVVGRGAFGKVRIVERKDTSLSFALKYIRKDEGMPLAFRASGLTHQHLLLPLRLLYLYPIFFGMHGNRKNMFSSHIRSANSSVEPVVKSESVRNIIRERRMLEHVNHPFICNLRYSFQDIEYMYAPPPPSLCEHLLSWLIWIDPGISWWI